jgi:hypothetical protein
MRKAFLLGLICALTYVAATTAQQNALQTAATTLGVATIKTLEFRGAGRNFSVGQNYTPADPWPAVTVKEFTATMNFDTASMRVELLREMGAVMPRGGGAPFTGQQRQIQLVSGNYAWNMPPAAPGAPAPQAAPNAAAQPERMLALSGPPPKGS